MDKRTSIRIILIALVAFAGIAAVWMMWNGRLMPGPAAPASGDPTDVPEGMARYIHPSFRFSFVIPETMKAESAYEKGGGETVVFTDASTEPEREMQLYIIPYDKKQITSSQIAKDTRGHATGTPREVVLGSDIRGLLFETDDPAFGRLREVWFILNGHLIEVTADIKNDEWLSDILATLRPNTL